MTEFSQSPPSSISLFPERIVPIDQRLDLFTMTGKETEDCLEVPLIRPADETDRFAVWRLDFTAGSCGGNGRESQERDARGETLPQECRRRVFGEGGDAAAAVQ